MEEKTKKPVTNQHFAALFFALFFGLFFLFVFNRYTMTIIVAFVCLNFAIAFKTWDIIREVRP